MSACFVLGAKSGTKKSNGKWYGYFTVLFVNQYGQWATDNLWFDDKETYSDCLDQVSVGDAVRISRDMAGKCVGCSVNEDVPPLELPPIND